MILDENIHIQVTRCYTSLVPIPNSYILPQS